MVEIKSIYLANNPNADKGLIEREEIFFSNFKDVLKNLEFDASSLAGEDCPNFEKKVYFEIARDISLKIVELCELGSYIAVDPSANQAYSSTQNYIEVLDGFVKEAKTLKETIYLKTSPVDKAIERLEIVVTKRKG